MAPSASLCHQGPALKPQLEDKISQQPKRTHRKSRLGCNNCRLRRVKCDESKPLCKRCVTSGFACTYSRSGKHLQLDQGRELEFVVKLDQPNVSPPRVTPSPPLRVCVDLPLADSSEVYELCRIDHGAIEHFRCRTALDIPNVQMAHLYNGNALRLVSTSPYLLHIIIAISLLHCSYDSPSIFTPAHRAALDSHLYNGISLFNRHLSTASCDLSSAQKDSLWAASMLLITTANASISSPEPETAWPLKTDDPEDLAWLRLMHANKAMWALTDPSRPDSSFFPTMKSFPYPTMLTRDEMRDYHGPFPRGFISLFDICASTTAANNPYFTAVSILSRAFHRPVDADSFMQYGWFMSKNDKRYFDLLGEKDPRALLLLLYWYSKMAQSETWWHRVRPSVEGRAICEYLERYHGENERIMELLAYPRTIFVRSTAAGCV